VGFAGSLFLFSTTPVALPTMFCILGRSADGPVFLGAIFFSALFVALATMYTIPDLRQSIPTRKFHVLLFCYSLTSVLVVCCTIVGVSRAG
jgi:hypothetical protein